MKSKITWLRISYWAAAIADLGVAISILIPERAGVTEFVYPMGLMSAVALSWAILLLIADRKPLERRWVLIPTIIVVFFLTGVSVYAAITEMIDFRMETFVVEIILIFLLTYSYMITKRLEISNSNNENVQRLDRYGRRYNRNYRS